MDRKIALQRTILQCEVGSSAWGLNLESGDRDEMGVMVESVEQTIPVVGNGFEQYIYRSAEERSGIKNAPSEKGDLDLTVYSLRKWAALALKGNPTVLSLLFAPVTYSCADGESLRGLAPHFASKEAGKRFSGYLRAQRERLIGERGQKDVNRPELVKQFGFDTKYAMHMLRLGMQGIEYLRTGKLSVPMRDVDRQNLLDVRQGKYDEAYCIGYCRLLEEELEELIHGGSPLPDKPNYEAVQRWVTSIYLTRWMQDNRLDGYYPY